MNNETYAKRIVSGNYMAYTMPSGLTLYTENMPHNQVAYILTLADGQGLTWSKDLTQDWTWTDRIINNAVRNETDLHRLGQLLGMYGIESHWCNHVVTPPTVKETTITVVRPVPQDGDDNKLPNHFYVIKESPLGLTWVHIYKWADMRAAADTTDAMNVIRGNERLEQA